MFEILSYSGEVGGADILFDMSVIWNVMWREMDNKNCSSITSFIYVLYLKFDLELVHDRAHCQAVSAHREPLQLIMQLLWWIILETKLS